MNSEDVNSFRESAAYSSMRPYLLRSLIDKLENDAITLQSAGRGAGANNFKPQLFDDITRIEKHWDLI